MGFTCRLCHAVRVCLGLALVTWWQSGCQPVSLPAWGEQWPLALPPPACTLVRGQAALCLGFQPLSPGPPDRVAVEDWPGRTEPQPHPEAGGRFLSSASTWMGTVPRKRLVPNQKGVRRGDRIRQKEDVLVLTEEKLQIYHFQNQKFPPP